MPRRVQLRYHTKTPLPPLGSRVKLRASLKPPPEPVIPGGFDFARNYWFEGLGATGFVLGKVELVSEEPPPWDMRLSAVIANLRQAIASRIAAVLSGETGGLAQALIMGERAGMSEETRLSLTGSGLAHVVSISGFHMALTAGSAFWLIRALLAAFPGLALAFPIKIWAAVAALIVATFYLLISGSSVAAVRSYIMIAIMFAAIAVNRPALSLRNLAMSALLILALTPESLVDAGFQMSFAATAALIAVYEGRLNHFGAPRSWPWLPALVLRILVADIITSLAASLAVDPIGAYHFHRVAAYSVLGNLLAMPAVSLIVMPMALLALVAMPFGLEAWPLLAMGAGIEVMTAIASWVAHLPGAVILLSTFSLWALLLMVGGGLWLLIWRRRWRLAGIIPIAAGLATAPFTPKPDIWIDRDGQVIAVRLKDGSLSAPKSRKGEFSIKAWLEADGDSRTPKDVAKGTGFQCDEQSCLALVRGRLISHVLHPAALADDCRRASILITSIPVTQPCPGPQLIIDAHDLWENGAQTVTLGHGSGAVLPSSGDRMSSSIQGEAILAANTALPPGAEGSPAHDVDPEKSPAAHPSQLPTPGASQNETDRGLGIRLATVAGSRGTRPWVIPRHRRELITAVPDEAANRTRPGKRRKNLSGLEEPDAPSQ